MRTLSQTELEIATSSPEADPTMPLPLGSTLAETIRTIAKTKLVAFPAPEEGAFRKILDWEMGYTD